MSHTILGNALSNHKLGRLLVVVLVLTATLAAISGWAQAPCVCEDNKKEFRDGPAITVGIGEANRGVQDTYVVPLNNILLFMEQCSDLDEYKCDCATWENPCTKMDMLSFKWSCSGAFTATGNPDLGHWTSPDGESPTDPMWYWTPVRPGVYTITLRANDLGTKPPDSAGECDDVAGTDPSAAGAPSKTVTVKAIGGAVWSTNHCTGEYPVTKPDGCGACQEKTVQYTVKWAQPPGTTLTWTASQPADPVVATAGVGNDLQVSPVRKSPNPHDVMLSLQYALDEATANATLQIHCQASQSVDIRSSTQMNTGPGQTAAKMCKMKWIALKDQHGCAIHNVYCNEQLTACQGSWSGGPANTYCHDVNQGCLYSQLSHGTAFAGEWPDHVGYTRASPAWTGAAELYARAHQNWYAQGAHLLHQALHEIWETPEVKLLWPSAGCP